MVPERAKVIILLAVLDATLGQSCDSSTKFRLVQNETDWEDQFIREMSTSNIESNLRYLTSQPHAGGTKADFDQAEFLRALWTSQGMDQVSLEPYEVLLSYPEPAKPSRVQIIDDEGKVKFTSALLETPIGDEFYDSSVLPAYLAYSASGIIEADHLIYVNYGSFEDFRHLKEDLGMSVEGKLVLVRYGKFFRGDKVLNAQRFGAAGVILYSDPADYAGDHGQTTPYPNSWWLPGEGIQRGTIIWHDGDPSTPMYPAISGAHRISEEKMDLPKIPVHPVSYNDARKLLVQMAGPAVPKAWVGALNISYNMGTKLQNAGWKIRLEVNNEKKYATTYNVIGKIMGAVEPDRYVILGNHRDAWVYGSVDPSSATAAMMEVVRTYTSLMKKGWRPRRTILVCSWGAGEFGYMGSNEWVEQHFHLLRNRAVAHLNLDIAVIYPYNLLAVGSPLVKQVMMESAKKVPPPDEKLGFVSLYDHWKTRRRFTTSMMGYGLSSVSDHSVFYQKIGVPTSYFLWMPDPNEWPNVDYPLYHSTYETFEAMKKFLDPDFKYHLAIGQLWGLMSLKLSSDPLLPMDIEDETAFLIELYEDLIQEHGKFFNAHHINTAYFKNAIERFSHHAQQFKHHVHATDQQNALALRQVNDKIIQVEKTYIYTEGLPRRPHMKNVLLGTSIFDQYSGWLLPGIREAIFEYAQERDVQKQLEIMEEILIHLTVVTAAIEEAIQQIQ